MMNDVDGLSRYIDILIHRYPTQASRMHLADIAKRPFAYSFDSFIFCSNPRRVTASDITITTEVSSTFSSLLIIQYSPLHFTSPSILQSYSVPKPIAHTYHHIVSSEDIILLSFDSIATSFGSLFSLWSGGTVTDFRFETNLHHHRIASFFSKSTLSQYKTLSHLFIPLNCLKIFVVDLISRQQKYIFTTIRTLRH